MDIVFEVVGWAGTALLVSAYFLVSVGRITNGRAYQWFNLLGAIGLLVNGAVHGAWPSVILNVVWSGIGVFSLVQLARKRAVNAAETPASDAATI